MFQFLIKKIQMKHVAFSEIEIFFISILKKFISSQLQKEEIDIFMQFEILKIFPDSLVKPNCLVGICNNIQ